MAFLESAPPLTMSRASPIRKPQIRNLKHRLRRTRHVKCSRLVAEDAFDKRYRELDLEYHNFSWALKKGLGHTSPPNSLQEERLGLGFSSAK